MDSGPLLFMDAFKDFTAFRERTADLEIPVAVDELLDGVYFRKAGQAKDMAFGMCAVLQGQAHFLSRVPIMGMHWKSSTRVSPNC